MWLLGLRTMILPATDCADADQTARRWMDVLPPPRADTALHAKKSDSYRARLRCTTPCSVCRKT